MKIAKVIGLAACAFIIFLMFYLALTQDGGYMSAKEVEESVSKSAVAKDFTPQKSAEELQLQDLRKNAGESAKASRLYTSKCSPCHGKNGEGTLNEKNEVIFPLIAGKPKDFISQRLDDYKNDRVKNPMMIGLLKSISDDDLKALAGEISSFEIER